MVACSRAIPFHGSDEYEITFAGSIEINFWCGGDRFIAIGGGGIDEEPLGFYGMKGGMVLGRQEQRQILAWFKEQFPSVREYGGPIGRSAALGAVILIPNLELAKMKMLSTTFR